MESCPAESGHEGDLCSHAPADLLLPGILERIASFLPANDVACCLRPVNRSTAELLSKHVEVQTLRPCPSWALRAFLGTPAACHALSYKRRIKLLCRIATSGELHTLSVALDACKLQPTAEIAAAAAAAGHLHGCRWLAERGCPLDGPEPFTSPLAAASSGGHLEVCDWLLDQGVAWDREAVLAAARGGRMDVARALLGRRGDPQQPMPRDWLDKLAAAAGEGCDLPTLQETWREWECEEQLRLMSLRFHACIGAARSVTPDWLAKVEWLMEQSPVQNAEACRGAAAMPDALSRLTLMIGSLGFPCPSEAVRSAARAGQAEAVEWLLLHPAPRGPCAQHPAEAAAAGGHTRVLEVLHALGRGPQHHVGVMRRACEGGHVAAVAWAVQTYGPHVLKHVRGEHQFAPLDAACCSGSEELVAWLGERGARPGRGVWTCAAQGGCVAVLEVLAARGVPMQDRQPPPWAAGGPYHAAALRGDLLTLDALRRLGVPLRPEVLALARRGGAPPAALEWLRQMEAEAEADTFG